MTVKMVGAHVTSHPEATAEVCEEGRWWGEWGKVATALMLSPSTRPRTRLVDMV